MGQLFACRRRFYEFPHFPGAFIDAPPECFPVLWEADLCYLPYRASFFKPDSARYRPKDLFCSPGELIGRQIGVDPSPG
jgi:hypothetical protein